MADGNAAANAVIAALQAEGLTEDAFRTTRISLSPEYDFNFAANERVLTGFRYNNSLQVTISSTDSVGDFLDAAVVAGGDVLSIDAISFQVSDRATLERSVLLTAIDDAIDKAGQMAERAGVTLGRATLISEATRSTPVSVGFAADEAALATPVFAGTQEISVTVQMEFEIS